MNETRNEQSICAEAVPPQQGNTGWHLSTGPKWHGLTIEEKCKYILEVWDAPKRPLDFKDSYRKAVDNVNRMNDKGEIPPDPQ